ncbi:MAG: alpha-E domain-containing protein [Kiritimatiellia bacterium]
MLSRVADSIYWLGRYVERAENVARLIDVNLQLQLDLPGEERPWEPVIRTGGNDAAFFAKYSQASLENALTFLTFDRENPSSILCDVARARENARTVRENIPSELWTVVNHFYLRLAAEDAPGRMLESPHEFFDRVKEFSQLAVGIMQSTLNRDEAWNFARIGRMIERADQTSRILDTKYFILLPDISMVGMQLDNVQWTALLKSCSAFQMFRQRHSEVTPRHVSEFLLLSKDFPRSVRYCLKEVVAALRMVALPNRPDVPSLRLAGKLHAEFEFATIGEIIDRGLHEYIDNFQTELAALTGAIWSDFFK